VKNGGQYTHAASWLALACLKAGEINTGYAILSDLLPFKKDTNIYKAEPMYACGCLYHSLFNGQRRLDLYTGRQAGI
jgi:cellobiose phosphorylase